MTIESDCPPRKESFQRLNIQNKVKPEKSKAGLLKGQLESRTQKFPFGDQFYPKRR